VQGTDVQTEREVGRVMETMLGKLEIQERTEQIASGKIQKKKGRPAMSAEEKAARKESRELAKREALIRPVEGIPIPQEIQQVAELKPREFQEGSLLADIEGAVRLPQARESKLASRVASRRGVSFSGDVGGSGSESDEYQRYIASTGGRSRSSFSGRQSFTSEGFQSAEEDEPPLAQGSFV